MALGYEDPLEAATSRAAAERLQRTQLRHAEELLRAGRVQPASALLESLVSAEDQWAAARHLLARAYFQGDRWTETRVQLEWLEVHGVEHAELALMRAAMALRQRRWNEAVEQASYAKCLQSPLLEADLVIAEERLRRGDAATAERTYLQVLELAPANVAAKVGLSAIAVHRREYESGADWALHAIEHDPRRWQAHCHLGRALSGLGRVSDAEVALQNAARLAPSRLAPLFFLMRLCQVQSDSSGIQRYRGFGRVIVARRRATAAGTSAPNASS